MGENLTSEEDLQVIEKTLENKYIMSQVLERFMRVQIVTGVKCEELFDKVMSFYTGLKRKDEDDTIYDLFVTEFNNRDA